MANFVVRVGVTDPMILQCKEVNVSTGVETPVILSGATAAVLHLRNIVTRAIVGPFTLAAGKLSIYDAVNGKVKLSQNNDDLPEGLYDGYLLVTDVAGKVLGFPSDGSFRLTVIEAY